MRLSLAQYGKDSLILTSETTNSNWIRVQKSIHELVPRIATLEINAELRPKE